MLQIDVGSAESKAARLQNNLEKQGMVFSE